MDYELVLLHTSYLQRRAFEAAKPNYLKKRKTDK
jgi:hypothetical protein